MFITVINLLGRINWFILRRYYRFFTWIAFYINGVDHGKYSSIGIPMISVSGKGSHISIGQNIKMNNGAIGNPIGFISPCQLSAHEGGKIIIEENVGMSQTSIFAISSDITVGHHTLLGGGVKIYSSDFHSLNFEDRRNPIIDKKNRLSSKVIIGHDCFIGAGSIILKGVSIGDCSVIGAGSVVSSDIPAHCIAAGNPAKVIRSV